jgi:hypothetical protein
VTTSATWEEIKNVWQTDADKLGLVASAYNVQMAAISIKATQDAWGVKNNKKGFGFGDSSVLNAVQVQLAHKTDLGRLRLMAACVMEKLTGELNHIEVLKVAERLSKIYAVIIPLERKIFGLDGDIDDTPDSVVISVKGK